MRISTTTLTLTLLCCIAAVSGQSSDPVGPITTDNGVSACVEFGSCSTGGPYSTTETQEAPVTSPASSPNVAAPTNAFESSASISALAASGAAAAYSSRVANGQGSGNAPDGSTSIVLTATAIAGTTPAASSTSSKSGSADAALKLDSGFQHTWTAAMAFVGVIAGALVVL